MNIGLSINKINQMISNVSTNVVASVDESFIDVTNIIKTDSPGANNSSSEQSKTYNIQEDCYIYLECFGVSSSYDVKIYAYINDVMVYKCFNVKADYTERQSQIIKAKKGDKFKVTYSGGGYTLTMYGMSKQITNYVPEDALGYEGMSNWELWTSFAKTSQVQLPNEWEEIKLITTYKYYNFETTFSYDEYQELYNYVQNQASSNYFSRHSGDKTSKVQWMCYENAIQLQTLEIDSTQYHNTNGTMTYVYYKKKNGVTVDYNDLGEWELYGDFNINTKCYLSELTYDYKELLLVPYLADHDISMKGIHIYKEEISSHKNSSSSPNKVRVITNTLSVNYINDGGVSQTFSSSVQYYIKDNYLICPNHQLKIYYR